MWVYLWVWTTVDDYSAMQWPCDTGFHVPMKSERQAINNIGISLWAWTSSEFKNSKSYLKLPYAWYRISSTSNASNQWEYCYYWCSTASWSASYDFSDFIASIVWYGLEFNRYQTSQWLPIRPFKDVPVIPDSNWTVLKQWTWTAWIYHNSSLWLISISSDWTTRYTIADKNLWATTVYNDWNTLSEANCWKYYQRWNNYWFPYSWSVTTSSTQVNAQNYWPWNYYSSSTFIKRTSDPFWWDSSNNKNLRWWVTGVQQKTIYPELKNAYIGEYRVPWVNTYIYYPLTSDLVDVMWNWNTWTMVWNCTFSSTTGIYVSGESWNYVTWLSIGINNRSVFTLNVWIKPNSYSSFNNVKMVLGNDGAAQNNFSFKIERRWPSSWYYPALTSGSSGIFSNSTVTPWWVWKNLCITRDSSWWYKYYVNWNLVQTWSWWVPNNYSTMYLWYSNYLSNRWITSYIKDYIVETVARTADGVSNYYNSTKSNYWL